jgi:hypothetical protein
VGRNENAAGDVQTLLEQLDDMIGLVNGANFFGHHSTKGNQAAKATIDRASGSGVFQRDPDSILTMTSREKDGCFTVELILRNHPPVDPFVIEWRYPLLVRESSLDPAALKQPGTQRNSTFRYFRNGSATIRFRPLNSRNGSETKLECQNRHFSGYSPKLKN